tara:strand:- start:422 stop:610 length:189 start_codon:yes stop_codon:yes gene_type:complete
MNNTELTLDQLAEVSAAGLFINTNSNALNFRVINPSEASLKAGDLPGIKRHSIKNLYTYKWR